MTRWWRLCLTLTLCRMQESALSDCDDGNRRAERDLIPYAMFKCPGPPWSEPSQKLPSIDTKFLPEPSLPVCMDSPIIYNKTIPNSGPHRPVGAEYGEYLYCPPQRWIQNLRGGATVLLFHPCVPTAQVSRLSMLARLCLSRYIISHFPQLSTERPLAIVTWGHTLELSHVMPSDVCDWLDLNAPERISGEALEKQEYRLLLRRAAEPSELRRGSQEGTQQEALRRCCVEAFSLPLEEGPRIGRERRRMKRRGRIESVIKDGKAEGVENRGGDGGSAVQQSAHWGSLTELSAGAGNVTHGPESHSGPGEERGAGSRESGRVAQGGQQGGRPQGQPGPPETQAAEKSQARGARSQEERRDPGRTRGKEQAQTEPLTPADASQAKGEGGRPECGGLEVEAVRERQGLRVPTPRTDEAVWAAAALGFLLLLLTLSVLHTRLYRNWRSPLSLYWPRPEQEHDSVADVIRRRLKLLGQRKRRGPGGRRQECVLLPSSSSEDSD